ncbi:MAG: hypothetical protein U0359_21160 [Byssovorax sp.]
MYAPRGSPAYLAVDRALAKLADERFPVPGPKDQEDLRSPVEVIWARRVEGAELIITYSIMPLMIEIRTVRPAW